MNNSFLTRPIPYYIAALFIAIALVSIPQKITTIKGQIPVVISEKIDYFKDISIKAKAVYVFDIAENKVLYERNAEIPLPLASLTKVMTAITASKIAPDSTEVAINTNNLKQEGDSGLYNNERWNLGKLLQYMLVVSSNDGAAAVADSLGQISEDSFVSSMNNEAQELNLSSMKFNNSSGLDESKSEAGAYGSAHDVATLLTFAAKNNNDIFESTRYSKIEATSNSNLSHKGENTNVLVNSIPGLIIGKTGSSDLAGGNLAVLFDVGIGHPVVTVVLGSTNEERFTDMKKLVDASVLTITQTQ